ncbi:hypothetical protein N7462_000542 [Penicillium macrosclerotiorum]|uniref:uncharacterized protein n=1 Tax=Penicillium macrosclerotiorum TaxID=303699 RepID=UPI0025479731|nr:uncharacterized protein N7462_000542 [Penicillium macrosclerotiorum]KAJ5698537.1 hypothetical protein N7462_000542 [Penicillium macrosclerotiorum]
MSDIGQKPVRGGNGLYQCGHCKRNYTRADHLIRHIRSQNKGSPNSIETQESENGKQSDITSAASKPTTDDANENCNFCEDSLQESRLSDFDWLPSMQSQPQESLGPDSSFDFNLTKADLEFLDSLNSSTSFNRPKTASEHHSSPKELESSVISETEALHNSPLAHWTPRAEDNAYMDQRYLSIPEHLDRPSSTPITFERLSASCRDSAFAVVATLCRQRNFDRILDCFPSAKLLDRLIQKFLNQQRKELDAWIHEPTIDLKQQRPELIIALAAAGAVLSSNDALKRLGYALLEIARIHLTQNIENDNSLTRNLRSQQAYALVLQVGLWSGDKRRMEIAESLEQPLVTMLRRTFRFRDQEYADIVPPNTADEKELEIFWHQWVELESYKRLVYHMFLHDIQAAILLSTNPLISHAELTLPFPCDRRLWEARTAKEWKEIYTEGSYQSCRKIPSLADVLRDLSALGQFPDIGDYQLAALISVHGIYTIVADCNHTRNGQCGSWGNLLFQSWQRELQKVLETFGVAVVESLVSSSPLVSLVHQTISLSLYVPLDILEAFAGKDGQEKAIEARRTIADNVGTSNFRQACWHAGQILRVAKSMPAGSLTNFCTTCLYFAALSLWTYGTIFLDRALDLAVTFQQNLLILDGETQGTSLHWFIVSGKGHPAILSEYGPVTLERRCDVIRVFKQVLQLNHDGKPISQQIQTLYCALLALESFSKVTDTY